MYRFGEAAAGAGITEGQLRNWIARYDNLWLPSERENGVWREFSARDVIVLAFIAELTSYGATVPMASEAGFVFLAIYGASVWQDECEDTMQGPRKVWCTRDRDGSWQVYETEHKARCASIMDRQVSMLQMDGQALIQRVLGNLHKVRQQPARRRRQSLEQVADGRPARAGQEEPA